MNTINSALIFWLYYAQGLLYKSLQKHKEAIDSFDSALDFQQYYAVLCEDSTSLKTELDNHKQILSRVDKNLNRGIANANELANKNIVEKSFKQYSQITELFSSYLDNSTDKELLSTVQFGVIFDMPFTDNESQNFRLQCAYAHYNKALSQIALQEQEEALKSLHISNKLLPEFYPSYIAKAEIYKGQREFMKAVVQYDMAIRLEENNPDSYFNRSVLLFEIGKTKLAKEDFVKWQSLNDSK